MNILPKDNTPQENVIAECLSEFGLRYSQQYEFFPYTADFFVPELGLVIEADGKYGHLQKRDVKRDIFIAKQDNVEYLIHIKDFTKKRIKEILWQGLNKLEHYEPQKTSKTNG